MTLDMLKPGQSGFIDTVDVERSLRCRLLDMGLIPGTRVEVRKMAPLGDPIEISLRGYTMTMRKADAGMITLRQTKEV
jgi:ferrous iron transport protein A